MSEAEIIHDAEVIGTELEPVRHGTLFGTDDPVEVIQRASRIAAPLAALVRKQKLTKQIGQKEHVLVEGWTLLGSMLGVFPVTVWTRRTEHEEGWEARVEARTRDGAVIGAAEAECTRTEKMWSHTPTNKYGKALDPRDDYALRSMAQTRATSKALRMPLGFVMQLAGFDPTPAEEMPRDGSSVSSEPQARQNTDAKAGVKAPTSWGKLTEMVSAYDQQIHDWFFQFRDALVRLEFAPAAGFSELKEKQAKDFVWQKCVGAALHLRETYEPGEFPPPTIESVRVAFASVLDGVELAVPEEELDAEAAEAAARES